MLKKLFLALALGGMLGACASGVQRAGVQANDLRDSSRFVTEVLLPDMNFPLLQRSLFQHRAACGSAPRFFMHEGETGYASLVETDELPASYENVILADLVHYLESWRAPERVAVRVYSYYYNDDVQRRIDRMLDAVRRPGQCAPQESAG